MDRDVALSLVDVLGDIKEDLDAIKLDLDAIVVNTTPADDGGETTPDAGGET